MRQLRLVGVAEDGASLLLETPTGEAFRLPLDERVRAACRGDLTRLGQIEIELDNPLRPREIQTRVRAGESAEEVAASAGMPLDRVLRFAYPVLQERERVTAQARTTQVHPKRPETLDQLIDDRLVGRGTDAATLRWDSWRREDGRWMVRLSWRHAAEHSASWVFHLATRTLQPDDPAAEQLSAEEFHARTITAVTPLAVAARVSGRTPSGEQTVPPGPAVTSGERPARGVEARAGRSPGTEFGRRPGRASVPRLTGTAPGASPTVTATPIGAAGVAERTVGAVPPGPSAIDAEPTVTPRGPATPDGAAGSATPDPAAGSANPDRAAGADAPDLATGAAGPHRATGSAGPDRATGSAGPDRATGSAGSDRATGSAGPGRTVGAARSEHAGGLTGLGRTAGEAGPEHEAGAAGHAGAAGAERGGGVGSADRAPTLPGLPPIAAAAGESDEERARRASVPSWDDILLGVRRRH